jgi:hypothetical protein
MQRTKALGLLHKQIKKDSCMSRMGIPDYVLTFRKPGDNPERVTHTDEDFPVTLWQQWAEPIWTVADSLDLVDARAVGRAHMARHQPERHAAVPERARRRRRAPHLPIAARGDSSLHPHVDQPGRRRALAVRWHRERGSRCLERGPQVRRLSSSRRVTSSSLPEPGQSQQAPAHADVPWAATTTDWRSPIEDAVEDLPDPECWRQLETENQNLEDKVRSLEDDLESAESDNETLKQEVSNLEKQITGLLKAAKASAAE